MGETLKLLPNRRKWIFLGVLSILLAAGFVFMYAYRPRQNPSDESLLVVGGFVVFFLIGASLCFLMLSPDRNYLLLTPNGFTVRSIFKSNDFRWEEVEEFHTISVKGMTKVVYSLSPQGKLRFTESAWRKLNKALGGGEESLPDTYGMSAAALADLMNQWKKKAVR